jgi:hypothetical protein
MAVILVAPGIMLSVVVVRLSIALNRNDDIAVKI